MRNRGTKIVVFNGPPRSGKDTAAAFVQKRLFAESSMNPALFSFAKPLKAGLHELLQLTLSPGEVEFRKLKDEATPELGGMTYRQAYIAASENFVKPVFGQSAFGEIAVRRIKQHGGLHGLYLVTDCGFREELLPLARVFLPRNLLVVQIERPGHDFTNDSRSYVSMSGTGVATIRVLNNMPVEMYCEVCHRRIREWLQLPNS